MAGCGGVWRGVAGRGMAGRLAKHTSGHVCGGISETALEGPDLAITFVTGGFKV